MGALSVSTYLKTPRGQPDASRYRLLHLVSHVMNDARIRGVRSKERDVLSWIDEAGVKNWNEVFDSAAQPAAASAGFAILLVGQLMATFQALSPSG